MHHDSDWNYVNRADQNRVPNLSRARFDYKRKDEDDMAKSTKTYEEMVILVSMAIAIYFGDWIKEVLPINLLFLLLFVQLVYVGIRWYVKGWRENRGYV